MNPLEDIIALGHSLGRKDGDLPTKTSAELTGKVHGALAGRGAVIQDEYRRGECGAALDDQNGDVDSGVSEA